MRQAVSRVTIATSVLNAKAACTKRLTELALHVSFHVLNVRIAQFVTHALEGTFSQGQVAHHVSTIARHVTALHIARLVWQGITLQQAMYVRRVVRLTPFASIATHQYVRAASWVIS